MMMMILVVTICKMMIIVNKIVITKRDGVLPIVITLVGMVTDVNPVNLNASSPSNMVRVSVS